MDRPLKILHLEDDPNDAELVEAALAAEGIACELTRASTCEEFAEAIEARSFDLILSDFGLPGFDGFTALSMAQQRGYQAPFIFVSGTLGEETAIESLRSGATDYVLKHRLKRLAPAVRRALSEAEERAKRKEVERFLSDSEERFRTVFEDSPIGMATFGDNRVLLSVNEAYCAMLGRTRLELVGSHPADLVHAEDLDSTLGDVADLFSGRILGFRVERRYRRSNGDIVWGNVTASLIRYGAGKVPIGLEVVEDITERKTLEEQFRMAQKMEAVGRLASGVAHDFNNLLSVITGYGEMALAASGSVEGLHQHIEQILFAAERASSLTRQLLAFSRKQVIEPKILDLNAVLAELDKMLRRLIGEDVKLVPRLDRDIGRIKADRGQMEQIVMNLVVNARDAMPSGGTVTIGTADAWLDEEYTRMRSGVTPGAYVVLSVGDTGIGMTPDVQARIFEPFFTTKEAGKGTGLGLATVYGIVQQCRGDIRVDSEEGRGTTFQIFLPCIEQEPEARHTAETDASPRGTETVLVMEDEDVLRELVRESLQVYGYTVLAPGDVHEALQLVEQEDLPIDLLLTDVVLPDIGGRDLARRMTSQRPGLRVLYMSGYTDDAIVHLGVLERGVPFLQKPFALTALACKVREVLDAKGSTNA